MRVDLSHVLTRDDIVDIISKKTKYDRRAVIAAFEDLEYAIENGVGFAANPVIDIMSVISDTVLVLQEKINEAANDDSDSTT